MSDAGAHGEFGVHDDDDDAQVVFDCGEKMLKIACDVTKIWETRQSVLWRDGPLPFLPSL